MKLTSEADLFRLMGRLGAALETFGELTVKVELPGGGDKRTQAQNAKMWAMVREITEVLNHKFRGREGFPLQAEDMKLMLLDECFGKEEVKVGKRVVYRYPETSRFNTEQMARFIDFILNWAGEKRIPMESFGD